MFIFNFYIIFLKLTGGVSSQNSKATSLEAFSLHIYIYIYIYMYIYIYVYIKKGSFLAVS